MAVNNTQIIVNNGNVQTVINSPSPSVTIAAGSAGTSLAVPPLSLVGNYTGVTVNPPLFITLGTNLSFAGGVLNAAGVSLVNGNATTFNVNKVDWGGPLTADVFIDGSTFSHNIRFGDGFFANGIGTFGINIQTAFLLKANTATVMSLDGSGNMAITPINLNLFGTSAVGQILMADDTFGNAIWGTVSNGLTTTLNTLKWGGPLTANTNIDGAFDLGFGQSVKLSSLNVSVTGGIGLTASGVNNVSLIINTDVTVGMPGGGFFVNGNGGTNRLIVGSTGIIQMFPSAMIINFGSDATGDTYYRDGSGHFVRLPIGSSTQVLTVTGGVPVWAAASGGGMTNPMTTTGDMIQANPGSTPVRIAAVATGNALISGGIGTINSWGKITSSHIDATVQTAGLSWLLASGGIFTGANTIDQTTTAGNILKFLTPNLGVTSINGKGIWIQNATAAAAGAQQISGGVLWEGQGWATTPVASQSVQFIADALPVQGAANPTGTWRLRSNINGAGYTNRITVSSTGVVSFPTVVGGAFPVNFGDAGGSVGIDVAGKIYRSGGNLELVSDPGAFVTFGTSSTTQSYMLVGATTGGKLGLNISPTATLDIVQLAVASSWQPAIRIAPGAHTSLTAATEFKDYTFGTRTATWLAGTTATQRFAHFQGQTVAGASASATFTDLYTVYIDPSIQGSQAIITNNWALGLGGGLKLFAGTTTRPALVLPTGTNLTSSLAGAIENDGTHLWVTFANGGARAQLDNQVTTFGWALAGNTLVADGIIGDIGTGGFKISLYTNNTARQVITSKGNFTFTQDTQSVTNTFLTFNQAAHTGGWPTGIVYTGGASTTLTPASNTIGDLYINGLSRTVQFNTGNISTMTMCLIGGVTFSFVAASTITDAAGLFLSGTSPAAGTNATITNSHSLLIIPGALNSSVTNSYGLTVNASTSATNNWSAQFLGGLGVKFRQAAQSTTHTFIDIQQSAHTGGTPVCLSISGAAHTTLAAGVSFIANQFAFGQTSQFASNTLVTSAHTLQLIPNGFSFATAGGIITNASSLNIIGSPISVSNCNITNSHGILISSASAGAGTTNSYGITVNAMTTATNNYAAQFLGGRVNFAAGTTTYAPILLNSGTNTTTAVAGAVEYDGTNLFFTPSGTTRKTAALYQVGRATAQTAAAASVVTWTVGASDGSFLVSANVLVTTSTTHAFTVTCSYTDEGNTARVVTLTLSQLGGTLGTSIANTAGTVPYEGVPLHIRCKASTTITIATTGTFTSVTYNVEGSITQIN